MAEKTKSPVKEFDLTDAEQQRKKLAQSWLNDAYDVVEAELTTATEAAKKISHSKRIGGTLITPPISSAPDHIKQGTQIDQQIWQAESAVEDEYEAERDGLNAYPSYEEEQADQKVLDIERLLHGRGDGERNIADSLYSVRTGMDQDGRPIEDRDDYIRTVNIFAKLEGARQAAIVEEQPDPLRTQIDTEFVARW